MAQGIGLVDVEVAQGICHFPQGRAHRPFCDCGGDATFETLRQHAQEFDQPEHLVVVLSECVGEMGVEVGHRTRSSAAMSGTTFETKSSIKSPTSLDVKTRAGISVRS
jgi:hypothetical protein